MCIRDSPGPTRIFNPNGISIGAAMIAGLTSVTNRQTDRPTDHATRSVAPVCTPPNRCFLGQIVTILYNGPPLSPLQIAPLHGGSEPQNPITWLLGPTRVLNQTASSEVFAGLTTVTDWQTDRLTDHPTQSITIAGIYVCSTVMRPNNNN